MGSFGSSCDDLATTLAASQRAGATDSTGERRETSANPFGIYHSKKEKVLKRPFLTCVLASGNRQRDVIKRENQVETRVFCMIHILKGEDSFEHRDVRNPIEKRAYQAVGGEQVARAKLSEAQSELDRQEAKMQCADSQHHSQRMELYRANQSYDRSQREKSRFCTDVKMRDRALQEDRMKSFHEIEEFKEMSLYRN